MDFCRGALFALLGKMNINGFTIAGNFEILFKTSVIIGTRRYLTFFHPVGIPTGRTEQEEQRESAWRGGKQRQFIP